MTRGLQARLSTHWSLPCTEPPALGVGFPAPPAGGCGTQGGERSFPASPCCRLPLWHWLLHRPRSIPHSLCQQQSCSKPSLIKETHSLVLLPRGELGDALTDGTEDLRGQPAPTEGDRHWPRAEPTAVGCSASTEW